MLSLSLRHLRTQHRGGRRHTRPRALARPRISWRLGLGRPSFPNWEKETAVGAARSTAPRGSSLHRPKQRARGVHTPDVLERNGLPLACHPETPEAVVIQENRPKQTRVLDFLFLAILLFLQNVARERATVCEKFGEQGWGRERKQGFVSGRSHGPAGKGPCAWPVRGGGARWTGAPGGVRSARSTQSGAHIPVSAVATGTTCASLSPGPEGAQRQADCRPRGPWAGASRRGHKSPRRTRKGEGGRSGFGVLETGRPSRVYAERLRRAPIVPGPLRLPL